MKIFSLPESYCLKPTENNRGNSYQCFDKLTEHKLVPASKVETEDNTDLSHILTDPNAKVGCSPELKKTIEQNVSCQLMSGKVGSSKANYVILNPSKSNCSTLFKVRNIIKPYQLYKAHEFEKQFSSTINYLNELVDTYIIDEDDYILWGFKYRPRYSNDIMYDFYMAYQKTTVSESTTHNEVQLVLSHQTPIPWKNVITLNNDNKFTTERLIRMQQLCKQTADPNVFSLVIKTVNGFNLYENREILNAMLLANSLYRVKRRYKLKEAEAGAPLFNFRYYTGQSITNYMDIEDLLIKYEQVIRKRTNNFKVSHEDLEYIGKHFHMLNTDHIHNFNIKIEPKKSVV